MSALQTEFFVPPSPKRDAAELFAGASSEARGAVHTRPEVVQFVLDLVGWSKDQPLSEYRLLEPSAGEGDFLLPAVERLLIQVRPGDLAILLPCVHAIEVNLQALSICRERLSNLLKQYGWRATQVRQLLDTWLLQADFLTVALDGGFTHIVGNPPYIRLEALPKELLQLYRSRWRSLYDRADLYVAFIERSLELLSPEGQLGFICADRWMKNRYGGPLRSIVAQGFHLDAYVDFTECPAFFDEVDAYPAVSVIRRGQGRITRVAFRPEVSPDTLVPLARALKGTDSNPRVTTLAGVVCGNAPWMFDEDGGMEVIRKLEAQFPLMEETGCKVGIGVATGADKVFIGTESELNVEPERRVPLITTKDIRTGKVEWGGLWVLNPFGLDGRLIDLQSYPKFRAYVEKHRLHICRRNVAARNPKGWYRTIDKIHADLVSKPKLLIPDIKGEAHVVLESGRFYPHHNLYYVLSESWDLHALQMVLSSRLGRAFIAAYSPRMRGNFLRFQAQYLRRIRLPLWQKVDIKIREALVHASHSMDMHAADELVRSLYGLNRKEWDQLNPRASLNGHGSKTHRI